ncbi:MAG: ribonucleotide-diphosphate reductase subunit beta [Holosporaceae bacterium]|jgi:ribonucleoside-diphosphate reductase beta chain|nr:ribonucleotide-diphosphate reductase subunit beta [Holosporaceae bacterium]
MKISRRHETFSQMSNDQLKEPMFLGQSVNVARYDQQKYGVFEKLIEKQLSYFWRPEEVNVAVDSVQYKRLSEHEKHIFLSNLKYQTLMDSIQGRSPNIVFLPIVSLPELETWVETWSFSETVHSRSYTHIIRAIEPQPNLIFNDIVANEEIKQRAASISYYYDQLHLQNVLMDAAARIETANYSVNYNVIDHMKAIYMTLQAAHALEAIRFFASFACSFAFAERELMEGNAKIIKFIARDEMLHLIGTQRMILNITSGAEGKEWAAIGAECRPAAEKMFLETVLQEIAWTKYLFKDGSMLGLNEKILTDYIGYLAGIRMRAVGLSSPFSLENNPIPWINSWLSSDGVQVAPQEVEMSSYLTNQVNLEIDHASLGEIDI